MPDLRADLLPAASARPAPEGEIAALAQRYVAANGVLMQAVSFVGGQAEDVLKRIPSKARARIEKAARAALETAYAAARGSQRAGRMSDRRHRAAAMAMGAAGGLGGLPSALVEMPVTATLLLRAIQEIAQAHGEDLAHEETRLACLQVLGAGGPLSEDDGSDFAFLGARLALTGPALSNLMGQVAPRFAAILGQKLGAKAVPVIGALAGAGTNFAFARYYQDMAHVHFGLRRLFREGAPDPLPAFRARVEKLRAVRRA
jgi:hypothetical protein